MNQDVKARIESELKRLMPAGSVRLFENPDVVVYYNLPSTLGVIDMTDVMVQVSPGYPGAMLDYAFLPEKSPLLNVVKGAPQGFLDADGRRWQQVSYHPHNGGGAPPWNSTTHGFHTYIDEILTWLAVKR